MTKQPSTREFVAQHRDRVRILAATGFDRRAIANAVGLSVTEMMELFGDDVRYASARVQGELLEAAYAKARDGDMTAIKFVTQRVSALPIPADEEAAAKKGSVTYIGKKEQREKAALATVEAGNVWSDLMRRVE